MKEWSSLVQKTKIRAAVDVWEGKHCLIKSNAMIKLVTFVILGVPLRILLMIMNGVSCFQLSLSFPEIFIFEKFVKCAKYEADNSFSRTNHLSNVCVALSWLILC